MEPNSSANPHLASTQTHALPASEVVPPAKKQPTHGGEGHRARLRARFNQAGFSGFAPHEIIELLLTLCIPRKDVKPTAKVLLQTFGSVRGVLDAPLEKLQAIPGMGEVAPTALRIVRETANLYTEQSATQRGDTLNTPEQLEGLFRGRMGGLKHEVFEIALLDSALKLKPGGILRLSEGTVDQAAVYPREVVKRALENDASAIVLAHNHPSGTLEPSQADIRLTQLINLGLKPLGIRLLEHIILSEEGFYSFRRNKLLG